MVGKSNQVVPESQAIMLLSIENQKMKEVLRYIENEISERRADGNEEAIIPNIEECLEELAKEVRF